MQLRKIVSGGQQGADQAGLHVARRFGLETGGIMPKGFRTLDGSGPAVARLYGMMEHSSAEYPPRTAENVKNADATVRLAGDFNSAGEKCTLRAIEKYKKPYFDVDLSDWPPYDEFVRFLRDNKVEVLNVAGNTEKTYLGAFTFSAMYLTECFFRCGLVMSIDAQELLEHFLKLDPKLHSIHGNESVQLNTVTIRRLGNGTDMG